MVCAKLLLLQHGYPITNIPGNTQSRLAYFNALEQCNIEQDSSAFHALIAGYVLNSIKQLL